MSRGRHSGDAAGSKWEYHGSPTDHMEAYTRNSTHARTFPKSRAVSPQYSLEMHGDRRRTVEAVTSIPSFQGQVRSVST